MTPATRNKIRELFDRGLSPEMICKNVGFKGCALRFIEKLEREKLRAHLMDFNKKANSIYRVITHG